MSMRFEAIQPLAFNANAFRFEMQDTMERLMGGILHSFTETTRTWEDQPSFETQMHVSDDLMEVHVFCDALRDGDRIRGSKKTGPIPAPINLVYYFLNQGTDIRYATMEPDFIPKTRVRVINSFPGRGRVAGVSTMRPRPGIKGRFWDQEIKKRYDAIFPNQLRSALVRGVRNSGHAFDD